jgi:hypothetical protein
MQLRHYCVLVFFFIHHCHCWATPSSFPTTLLSTPVYIINSFAKVTGEVFQTHTSKPHSNTLRSIDRLSSIPNLLPLLKFSSQAQSNLISPQQVLNFFIPFSPIIEQSGNIGMDLIGFGSALGSFVFPFTAFTLRPKTIIDLIGFKHHCSDKDHFSIFGGPHALLGSPNPNNY